MTLEHNNEVKMGASAFPVFDMSSKDEHEWYIDITSRNVSMREKTSSRRCQHGQDWIISQSIERKAMDFQYEYIECRWHSKLEKKTSQFGSLPKTNTHPSSNKIEEYTSQRSERYLPTKTIPGETIPASLRAVRNPFWYTCAVHLFRPLRERRGEEHASLFFLFVVVTIFRLLRFALLPFAPDFTPIAMLPAGCPRRPVVASEPRWKMVVVESKRETSKWNGYHYGRVFEQMD